MYDKAKRIAREKKTVEIMIRIYCRGNHDDDICQNCKELLDYAWIKLSDCPLRHKPTCLRCKIKCYDEKMRQKIKAVMRYSGPRMIYLHPILALRHFLDQF